MIIYKETLQFRMMYLISSLFVDTLNENYNLSALHPGIDLGSIDLNRNGILWNNDLNDQDPDGTRSDIGFGYYHKVKQLIIHLF